MNRPMSPPSSVTRATSRTEEILRKFHEEEAYEQSYDWRLTVWLWRFIAPHRGLVIGSLAAGVVTVLLALLQPLVVRYIIDHGAVAGESTAIVRGGFALAVLVVLQQGANVAQAFAIQIAGARAVGDMRQQLFEFIHTLRLGYFDRTPVGRLVTRVTNDTDAILELFSSGAFKAITDLLQLLGIVVILLWMDWQLALVAFAAAPPTVLIVRLIRRKAREAFRTIRTKTARMNATMNEQVIGMTVVQAFGQQKRAGEEFDEINAAYRDANLNAVKYEAVQDAAIDMVQSICGASIIIALAFHSVTVGTLFAFNMYVMLFFEPISALAQRYTLLQRALSGAERAARLLETRELDCPVCSEEIEPANSVRASGAPALEFRDVSFSYKPTTPTLMDLSFSIEPGQKVALVGPTGAGKTTVASLALRLYEISCGSIRLFGKDIRSLDRKTLRRQFAVVPQDVFLFPGTLASNIAVGEKPDYARIRLVLERLHAFDLLAKRPGGLDAVVEEQGSNFSGGERQLIAFARAAYRDAPLLILDEATASVDSDTEARLQKALDASLEGRAALIIAHRLSTVRAADRILVFHKGRLVEQGNHQSLIALSGLYARLYELHFAKQASAATSS